jgi:hypothetical protein
MLDYSVFLIFNRPSTRTKALLSRDVRGLILPPFNVMNWSKLSLLCTPTLTDAVGCYGEKPCLYLLVRWLSRTKAHMPKLVCWA